MDIYSIDQCKSIRRISFYLFLTVFESYEVFFYVLQVSKNGEQFFLLKYFHFIFTKKICAYIKSDILNRLNELVLTNLLPFSRYMETIFYIEIFLFIFTMKTCIYTKSTIQNWLYQSVLTHLQINEIKKWSAETICIFSINNSRKNLILSIIFIFDFTVKNINALIVDNPLLFFRGHTVAKRSYENHLNSLHQVCDQMGGCQTPKLSLFTYTILSTWRKKLALTKIQGLI